MWQKFKGKLFFALADMKNNLNNELPCCHSLASFTVLCSEVRAL